MFILLQACLIILLLCVNYNPCYACGQAEYKIGDECCSMCHPGQCVYRHCTAWTYTSCVPCIDSTFNDQLTDLEECSPCTVCVQGLGVKTVRTCTPSSDTLCGVLEGHYCINPYKGGCRAAHKHTACKPGQFIKQFGTECSDTVCEDCSDNYYSDGSSISCKPHTDCESRGLVTVKAGDQAADSECGEKSNIGLTAGISVGAVAVAIAVIIKLLYQRKKICCIQALNKDPVPEGENMMSKPNKTYLILLLLCVNYNPCYACGQAEYKIADECCPMCSPGQRVYRHCTAWTSTSCVPCIGSTFNDQPNGLDQCSSCTVCDQDLGVKTVRACTPSSDTVCGVLEGHYCINPYMGGCRAAHKHTACKPGQLIKQPGTEYSDTVCEDCNDNSYSDGSFTSCKPHTDCESRGLVTVKAGDQAADSECGEKSNIGLSAGIAAGAIAAAAVIAAAIAVAVAATICICKKKNHGIQRQNKDPPPEGENMVPKPAEVEDDDVT